MFGPRTVPDVRYSENGIQGVVDAATRLQNSPDFIAWLPEARHLQIDLSDTHERRLRGAEALLVKLK